MVFVIEIVVLRHRSILSLHKGEAISTKGNQDQECEHIVQVESIAGDGPSGSKMEQADGCLRGGEIRLLEGQ